MSTMLLFCVSLMPTSPLEAGDHLVKMTVDDRPRSYRVHIPEAYDPKTAMPVVLIFHGSSMNGKMMATFSGLNAKSDEAGFIAVYPNGTGTRDLFLTFNAGEEQQPDSEARPDDVKFVAAVLDDLMTRAHVDSKRVYATGVSNGGMMCYRLAAELPDRIAAIAPVAGTMAVPMPERVRPMPVMHFHGTADAIVPFTGPDDNTPESIRFRSVDETVALWAAANECSSSPVVVDEPNRADDGTTVKRVTYCAGRHNREVILFAIEGGGHTWPGNETIFKKALGRSTRDISANDLMWDFFRMQTLP